jgi:hypothetical protein
MKEVNELQQSLEEKGMTYFHQPITCQHFLGLLLDPNVN